MTSIKKKSGTAAAAIAKMTDFKDLMCMCHDKACTDKVLEAMTKWGMDMEKEGGGDKAAFDQRR